MPRHYIASILVLLAPIAATSAQAPATFEVASVKANKSGATQVTVSWQGGVTMINVPLRAIVQFAYNINTPSRIIGHPDWTNVERFDIQAKPPEGATGVEQMRPIAPGRSVQVVGRPPVVDRTGISGLYDIEMTFTPQAPVGSDLANADATSIFTALEEQLGLKLDAQRELAEVLVIDRIDRPTEN
jgi:hypothetical protein